MSDSLSPVPFFEHVAAFAATRFQTAPLQTFLTLVTIYLLSIVVTVYLVICYWPLSDPAPVTPRSRRCACRSANAADAIDATDAGTTPHRTPTKKTD